MNSALQHDTKATESPALLLTSHEVAKALAISERTLWGLSAKGELPRVLIGRSVRYRFVDLAQYCERQARKESTPG